MKKQFALPHLYQPVDDSLVLWLKGSVSGDGKLFDLSKNRNHGTITGASWVNTPLNHPVLSFDGVDDYMDAGANTSLDITKAITMMAWVKYNNDNGGVIIQKGRSGGSSYNFGHNGSAEDMYMALQGITPSSVVYDSASLANAWHYIAGVYNGSLIYLYLDGVLVKSVAASGTINVTTTSLTLGGRLDAVEVLDWKLNGLIGEVRIYNRALSVSEISNKYNETKHNYGY